MKVGWRDRRDLPLDDLLLHDRYTELKKQIAALRKEIATARTQPSVPVVKEKVVERKVAVVSPADLRRLEALAKKIEKLLSRVTDVHATFAAETTKLQAAAREVKGGADLTAVSTVTRKSAGVYEMAYNDVAAHMRQEAAKPTTEIPAAQLKRIVSRMRDASGSVSHMRDASGSAAPADLKPAHLRLLSAIAWWASIGITPADLAGVAFIAKTSTKSSAFVNNRSYLRAREYIEYPSSGKVSLTAKGFSVAPQSELPPTNDALHKAIFAELQPAVGRILRVLIDAYPEKIALEGLAELAGTTVTSSAFVNNRSWLRARGLAEYPHPGFARAAALLFPVPL